MVSKLHSKFYYVTTPTPAYARPSNIYLFNSAVLVFSLWLSWVNGARSQLQQDRVASNPGPSHERACSHMCWIFTLFCGKSMIGQWGGPAFLWQNSAWAQKKESTKVIKGSSKQNAENQANKEPIIAALEFNWFGLKSGCYREDAPCKLWKMGGLWQRWYQVDTLILSGYVWHSGSNKSCYELLIGAAKDRHLSMQQTVPHMTIPRLNSHAL